MTRFRGREADGRELIQIIDRVRLVTLVGAPGCGMAQGDLDEAARLCEQSVSLFRRHGDRYGLGLALAFLGMTLQLAGDPDRADPCVREALDLNRSNGSVTSALYSLGSMSFGAIAASDMASLRANTTEVVGLLRKLSGKHEDRPAGCAGLVPPSPAGSIVTARLSGWRARPTPSPGVRASSSTSSYAGGCNLGWN
jgi:tetratricopeptide (TPR) repeat protein